MSVSRKTTTDSPEPSPSISLPKSPRKPLTRLTSSPKFDEPRLRQSTTREGPDDAPSPQEEESFTFEPFFTLIENPAISEHYHPTVHYIFADDEDAEILTEAACRALAQDNAQHSVSQGNQESKLPAPVDGVREHYIIVDVEPTEAGTTFEVTNAHSLSSEWQVTNASISSAPTIHDSDADPSDGLMLKIEAAGALAKTEAEEVAGKKELSLSERLEKFEKGMSDIRKLVAIANMSC